MRPRPAIAMAWLLAVLAAGQPAGASTFQPAGRLPGGENGFEPGIVIGPDQTIFVHAPAGLGPQSLLWRSRNGGQTFETVNNRIPAPFNRLPGGADSSVAVGDQRRVYFADLWAGSTAVYALRDNGDTFWQSQPVATAPLSDRPWLAVGGPGAVPQTETLYAVYSLIQPPNQVMFARSRDSGLTWDHHAIVPGPAAATGFVSQLVAAGEVVGFASEEAGALQAVVSGNAGSGWVTTPIASGVFSGIIPGFDFDGARFHAVWVDAATMSIRYASWAAGEAGWTAPITVSAGGTNMFPSVAGRAGKVAIAWYHTPTDHPVDPNQLAEDARWRVSYAQGSPGAIGPPDAATGVIKQGPVCTFGIGCLDDRELGEFLSLAVEPETGRTFIAFVDAAGGGGAKVVRQG